jgi:hypothetical protein
MPFQYLIFILYRADFTGFTDDASYNFFDLWVRWSAEVWSNQVAMSERPRTIQCTVNLGTLCSILISEDFTHLKGPLSEEQP